MTIYCKCFWNVDGKCAMNVEIGNGKFIQLLDGKVYYHKKCLYEKSQELTAIREG